MGGFLYWIETGKILNEQEEKQYKKDSIADVLEQLRHINEMWGKLPEVDQNKIKKDFKKLVKQAKELGVTDVASTYPDGEKIEDKEDGYKPQKLNESIEDEEFEDEPEEEDCVISDNTRGGHDVHCGGKFIGNFTEYDDALKAVHEWQDENNFWPNVWYISDHGNAQQVNESDCVNEKKIKLDMDSEEYNQGIEGYPNEGNPHKPGTNEHHNWAKGYNDAEEMDQHKKKYMTEGTVSSAAKVRELAKDILGREIDDADLTKILNRIKNHKDDEGDTSDATANDIIRDYFNIRENSIPTPEEMQKILGEISMPNQANRYLM